MMQELKDKQEKSQVLLEEVSKLPRNINRTMYTYRIMDIIASIGKDLFTYLLLQFYYNSYNDYNNKLIVLLLF